jgi:outer membrane cobalamin receptor
LFIFALHVVYAVGLGSGTAHFFSFHPTALFMHHLYSITRWVCFLLLCSSPFFAQAQVTITGTVLDTNGIEPIIGARIIGNNGETAAITNYEGVYAIRLQPRDTLRLRFLYIGYDTIDIAIPNKGKESYVQNVTMTIQPTELGEVIVSGSKSEQKSERLTVSVETMRPQQIDRQASSDITKSLEMLPGVTFTQGQVSIRGSSGFASGTGSRVVMMQDGLPLMSAEAGDAKFELVPTDNIRSIEVIKGAASVLYGSGGLGGVINIISAEPTSKPRTFFRVRGQVYDNPLDRDNKWSRTPTYGTSFHIYHARKIGIADFTAHGDLIRESGYRQGESAWRGRLYTQLKFYSKANPGLSYGFSSYYIFDSSGFFLGWRTKGNDYRAGGLLQPLIKADGSLDVVRTANHYFAFDPFFSKVTQEGNRHLYRGRVFTTLNLGPNTSQNATGIQFYNEYQYIHRFKFKRPGRSITLISGMNFVFSTILSDSIYSANADSLKQYGGKNKYAYSIAPYMQADIQLGRLSLNAGIRYQLDLINSVVVLNTPIARFGFNVEATKATFVRGSIGMGVRNPSIRERFIRTVQYGINVEPNPGIKPEKGFSAEVGVKQYFRIGGWKGMFDLAGFYMQFNDMVEYIFRNGVVRATNIATGVIPGVEANLVFGGKIGAVTIEGNIGYTYIYPYDPGGNKNLDGDASINLTNPTPAQSVLFFGLVNGSIPDRPYRLKYRNDHMVRSTLSGSYRGFGLTAIFRYNSTPLNVDKLFSITNAPGSREFRADHQNDQILLDLMLAKEFKLRKEFKSAMLSFHVFNVLNREYTTFPGILGAQRSFALQYKMTL